MAHNRMNILLFAYNFRHQKSIDFIYKLKENNITISAIISADYVEIKRPERVIKTPSNSQCKEHPLDLANRFNIPYFVLNHNSNSVVDIVKKYSIDLGVIAGARILEYKIIKLFNRGIINFHPALLPECRGLDSILWSIYNNYPLGVTSHLINQKIDAGNLVIKNKIKILSHDNLFSIHKKIYNLQLDLIIPSLNKLSLNSDLQTLTDHGSYNSYMSEDLQKEVVGKVDSYINYFSENHE